MAILGEESQDFEQQCEPIVTDSTRERWQSSVESEGLRETSTARLGLTFSLPDDKTRRTCRQRVRDSFQSVSFDESNRAAVKKRLELIECPRENLAYAWASRIRH
jgi:hypothetical protein